MKPTVVLDFLSQCRIVDATEASTGGLAETLSLCGDAQVRLLSDWGAGAVFGVSTVVGQASTAAAILEKQLRDKGETDDISHLLVHQSQARMGSTELVYTAVPIKTWRRYQQLTAGHARLVLIHDWVRSLMAWAKARDLASGTLVVLHAKGLDVLVLERGSVRALDRLQVFHDGGDAPDRLGQRVVTMVRDLDAANQSVGGALSQPALLLVCRGAESAVPRLVQGLSPIIATEVWAEQPDLLAANMPELPVKLLDWSALTTSLPLRQAVSRPLDKVAVWADRWAPPIGMAACALAFIMAVTSAVMHYQTQVGLASISGDVKKTQALWQTLNTDVQQAEQLAGKQKEMRDWVLQRVGSKKVPDMAMVLSRVRSALPPGMQIEEVGLVVEKGSHLVTVIGQAGQIDDSLRGESAFAQTLQSDGFALQKRDLLLREGQPKFKLSMIWSAS
jgi:negative regulator of sigma E activity